MQKEIDLLSFLSRVTEKNTKHYRSDFLYDCKKRHKPLHRRNAVFSG